MSNYYGDYPTSHTNVVMDFDTFAAATGAPTATTNFAAGDIQIYKDGGTTQRSSSAGITVSTSFDSNTGLQLVNIDLSDNTDAGFYAAGHEYNVAVADITADGQTLRFWLGCFSIQRAGGVLALIKAGTVKVDVDTIKTNPVVNGGTITFPTTATLASTTNITAATGVDITKILGTAISTPATAGVLDVNVKNIDNDAASASGTVTFPNATLASTTNITAGTITTATNVTNVNGIAANVITATAINAGAITNAKFAADTGLQTIRSNTAQAGGATTITLDASASAVDSIYNNDIVYITGGTGVGQARFISAYVGATKVATVGAWQTNPDNTSTFAILPFDAVAGATAPTAAQVATAVWQDATAGDFTTASSIGKALYISNIAPGGSGGHMISGSNAGTTTLGALTVTGATTFTGAIAGTSASNDLRVNGAVPGAAGGLFIAGTNAATAITTGLTTTFTGNLSGSVGSLATQAKADVNAEVLDVIATDTYAEPAQGAPAATTNLAAKINYLYKSFRNKKTQTSTTWSLFADDTTTVDQKSTVSDDGTTATRGEIATGP